MQIPIHITDEITSQLRTLTAENGDICRFTRMLMHSPDISAEDKHAIIDVQRRFILSRIEEIASGRNVGALKSPVQNPATLATINQITDTVLSGFRKPGVNA